MHSITFNGVNSRAYCKMFVSGGGTFNSPERDFESIAVPGRNGELTIDHGRYKNITVEYPAWIAEDFENNAKLARIWLSGAKGYKRLEDDYHPYEYRMARFSSGLEFSPIVSMGDHLAGTTTLKFDCMPQRFLKLGEETSTFNQNGSIENPTEFDALPLITITGSGSASLVINGYHLDISNIDQNVVIDSDIKRAYKGLVSKDSTVVGKYPVLSPGSNSISFSGGITRIEIIPRWWTL